MSRTTRTQKAAAIAQDRARDAAAKVKPAAAQMKPLARSTQEAAQRGLRAGRAWAAPRVERTGHVLQDSVAPKVAGMLSSAARRIEPEKSHGRRWWTLSGILILVAAGASAAAAALRKRSAAGDAQVGAGAAEDLKASASPNAAEAARKS